jgi:hypothetical protein
MTEEKRNRLAAQGFQPGVSGNPKGRTPEPAVFKMRLAEFLDQEGLEKLFDVVRTSDNPMAVIKGIEFAAKYVLPPMPKQIDVDVTVSSIGDFLATVAKRRDEIVIEATSEDIMVVKNDE